MEMKFTKEEIIILLSTIVYVFYLFYAIFIWMKLYKKKTVAVTIHLMFLCFLMGIFISVSIINFDIIPMLLSFMCMILFCKFNPLKDMGLKQPFPAGVLFLVYGISHGIDGVWITYLILFSAVLISALSRGLAIEHLCQMKKKQFYPFIVFAFIGSVLVVFFQLLPH